MVYRDKDEYEEKEAGLHEEAVRELLEEDDDDGEKMDIPEEEEKEWE
jgi:hypothetical protein